MPSTVQVFISFPCIGSTDCRPFRCTSTWEPLAFSNVAPCFASYRRNSFEFMGSAAK